MAGYITIAIVVYYSRKFIIEQVIMRKGQSRYREKEEVSHNKGNLSHSIL